MSSKYFLGLRECYITTNLTITCRFPGSKWGFVILPLLQYSKLNTLSHFSPTGSEVAISLSASGARAIEVVRANRAKPREGELGTVLNTKV